MTENKKTVDSAQEGNLAKMALRYEITRESAQLWLSGAESSRASSRSAKFLSTLGIPLEALYLTEQTCSHSQNRQGELA